MVNVHSAWIFHDATGKIYMLRILMRDWTMREYPINMKTEQEVRKMVRRLFGECEINVVWVLPKTPDKGER